MGADTGAIINGYTAVQYEGRSLSIIANADLFITTDDALLRILRSYPDIKALPPSYALSQVGR